MHKVGQVPGRLGWPLEMPFYLGLLTPDDQMFSE